MSSKPFIRIGEKFSNKVVLFNLSSGASKFSVPGGHFRGGRLRMASGWQFSEVCKWFLQELQKAQYFCLFFKKIWKPCVNLSRVWTKNTSCLEIVRKFWWKFSRKIEFFELSVENWLLKVKPQEIHFSTTLFSISLEGVHCVPPPGGAYDWSFVCFAFISRSFGLMIGIFNKNLNVWSFHNST